MLCLEGLSHDLLKTFLGFVTTVIVVAVSWHFFEGPIKFAKRSFSYRIAFQKEAIPPWLKPEAKTRWL